MPGKVFHNKLVRDFIEEKIKNKGETYSLRVIADEAEYINELKKKVHEESAELSITTGRAELIKEYADLMVVLDALTEALEISPAEIEVALRENIEQKGKFTKRHFLEWSSDETYKKDNPKIDQ